MKSCNKCYRTEYTIRSVGCHRDGCPYRKHGSSSFSSSSTDSSGFISDNSFSSSGSDFSGNGGSFDGGGASGDWD